MPKRQAGSVILDIKGYELDAEEKDVLHHPQVGGVIFFSRNYGDPRQITELCRQIKQLRPGLIVAVDQEGGRVQRFKQGFTILPPMLRLGEYYERSSTEALTLSRDLGWLMATELLFCGLDLSFAPVLDINKSLSSVIGDRAFADDPKIVTLLAEQFLAGMQSAGMKCTAKHFPGHGSVIADSHLELPVDARPLEDITHQDLTPFLQLAHRIDAIMPAHIIFSEVDKHPVGFSAHWLQQIARQQMGFNGVIISDDLSMAGAAYAGNHSERAAVALEAGCDGVLICNNPAAAQTAIEELELWGIKPNHRLSHMLANPQNLPPSLENDSRRLDIQRNISKLLNA